MITLLLAGLAGVIVGAVASYLFLRVNKVEKAALDAWVAEQSKKLKP